MITTPITAELLHGVADVEQTDRGIRPHRLPTWVREQFPDGQLLMVESQPSGVRLAVRTSATRLELVLHPSRVGYRGAPRPRGRVDVLVDNVVTAADPLTGGDLLEIDLQTGASTPIPGPPHVTVVSDLAGTDSVVEFLLPHNESVELIELRSDAPVEAVRHERRVWLHHGSSISHGSNAVGPSEIWPAVAALRSNVQLRNLGFGGSAVVDPFMARVMRDTPADVISVKLGINVVNLDGMRVRTFVPAVHGFLDTIRDGHPTTPLLLVSPIFCGIHEDTPGPGAFDPASFGSGQVKFLATGDPAEVAAGKLTLQVIRRELRAVVERRADPHLHYLDGLALYGAEDAERLPLPDALHPDTQTHQLIGERFADLAFGPSGPFGG
ncbi:lipase [Nakamurella sp. YIM 132087]|uniref:Lipase n=1 Tax=Nakamurella alba TaxID=2665158 RepID=A0A7K1FMV6_9ACTN|nr:SGNH/GDSL hydrolase family protein [Nakamurella alba]MTD15502.1 lipase [Nakamurella alba]